MRVNQNKEHLKKNRDATKLGRHWSKLAKLIKIGKKLVKNWYYVHFDTKIYIKTIKMKVI